MPGKKQIVIVEAGASDAVTKIANALKKKGYETFLISLAIGGVESSFLKESYSKVISIDFKFFKINLPNLPKIFFYSIKKIPKILSALYEIKKLKPYVVIARATPNWMCVLIKKYFKKYPFIYFPFDIRSFCYDDLREAVFKGIPKFEIASERYCFKNSDGIIHKGSEDELEYLKEKVLGEKIKVKCPDIFFFPYCLEEFMVNPNKKEKLSAKDKNIHIVYVGHVPTDETYLEGIQKIVDQKIDFHLYSKTVGLTKKEDKERIGDKIEKLLKNKFLHFHEPVKQKELAKEISKYDYGIYGYSTRDEKKNKSVKGKKVLTGDKVATGNKLASYLEAGLPIISSENYEEANKFLKKYGVVITFRNSKIGQLKKILEKNPAEKFEKKVIEARKKLSMEKNIPKLERFFEKVMRYKEKQSN